MRSGESCARAAFVLGVAAAADEFGEGVDGGSSEGYGGREEQGVEA